MQEELDCTDEYICESLEVVKNLWLQDSCHSKARQHQRDNPSSYWKCKIKAGLWKEIVTGRVFFKDKQPGYDGTTYIMVHYASCKLRFLNGITPHVQSHESEKLTYEKGGDL